MVISTCTSRGLPWKVRRLKRHLATVLMADSFKPYPNPLMILQPSTQASSRLQRSSHQAVQQDPQDNQSHQHVGAIAL